MHLFLLCINYSKWKATGFFFLLVLLFSGNLELGDDGISLCWRVSRGLHLPPYSGDEGMGFSWWHNRARLVALQKSHTICYLP